MPNSLSTPKGLHRIVARPRSGLWNPFGVPKILSYVFPGCAARPWALICNAFGVKAVLNCLPLLVVVATVFPAAAPAGAIDDVIDTVIYTDPNIPAAQIVKVFPERLTSLWLQALARPENDLKCKAAATIALAHRRGMTGLETTIAPLV